MTICQLLKVVLGSFAKYIGSRAVQSGKNQNDSVAGEVVACLTGGAGTLIVPACDDVLVEVGEDLGEVM